MSGARSATTRLLQATALALAASTLLAGLHDVSRAWDVWYYHLPFAARLAGLVGPDEYLFHAANQSRLAGFPLLVELLQGLAWRLTGRPEGANLVAMGSLALYVAFLRRAFRVPLHLAFLGLMAVPLVQIHVTSCYVDLPANAAAAALVLAVIRLHASAEAPRPRDGYVILGLAAVVANMRFQLHPLVFVAVLAALPRLLPPLWRARRETWRTLVAFALFVPLVGATFLRNAVVLHNPYYPMRLALGSVVLPGPDTAYSSSPAYLEHAPRALRWLCSVLEIGIRPFSDGRRWTIDQWAPGDSPALRMGGFFGAYVVFHLAVLGWTVARDPSRRARVSGVAFAAFTVVMANVPQSHELRYYLCWMLVLVSLNLWLVARAARGAAWKAPALGGACTAFLGVVLAVTQVRVRVPVGDDVRGADEGEGGRRGGAGDRGGGDGVPAEGAVHVLVCGEVPPREAVPGARGGGAGGVWGGSVGAVATVTTPEASSRATGENHMLISTSSASSGSRTMAGQRWSAVSFGSSP